MSYNGRLEALEHLFQVCACHDIWDQLITLQDNRSVNIRNMSSSIGSFFSSVPFGYPGLHFENTDQIASEMARDMMAMLYRSDTASYKVVKRQLLGNNCSSMQKGRPGPGLHDDIGDIIESYLDHYAADPHRLGLYMWFIRELKVAGLAYMPISQVQRQHIKSAFQQYASADGDCNRSGRCGYEESATLGSFYSFTEVQPATEATDEDVIIHEKLARASNGIHHSFQGARAIVEFRVYT